MEQPSTYTPSWSHLLPRLHGDILLCVLDFMPPQRLATLCRTSRELHRICTPRLYQSVDLSKDGPFFCARNDSHEITTLMATQRAFLECISNNPHVALRVESLQWHMDMLGRHRGPPPSDGFYPMTNAIHQVLERLPSSLLCVCTVNICDMGC